MPFSSYPELVASVNSWLDRTEQTADFIALAESRLNKRLRLRQQETSVLLTPDSEGLLDLPADYLEWRQLILQTNPVYPLVYVTPDFGATKHPEVFAGPAKSFTVLGAVIQTFPRAQQDVRLDYYARIPALTNLAQTNWLLTQSPDVYLYGALLEAFGFTRQPSLERFAQAFEVAVSDLIAADRGSRWARGGARFAGSTP